MTDRPIIFSANMVLALLADRKSMTRRLAWKLKHEVARKGAGVIRSFDAPSPWQRVQPGDQLWVRESLVYETGMWWYAADKARVALSPTNVAAGTAWAHHYERERAPSIHMPRACSRLTLIVTATKIERLQKITNGDCIAEGPEIETIGWDDQPMVRIDGKSYHHQTVRLWYHRLWDSLHGDGAWDENPEVVALSFTVHKQNIDAIEEAA